MAPEIGIKKLAVYLGASFIVTFLGMYLIRRFEKAPKEELAPAPVVIEEQEKKIDSLKSIIGALLEEQKELKEERVRADSLKKLEELLKKQAQKLEEEKSWVFKEKEKIIKERKEIAEQKKTELKISKTTLDSLNARIEFLQSMSDSLREEMRNSN